MLRLETESSSRPLLSRTWMVDFVMLTKSRTEEQFLLEQLGGAYLGYRHQVKQLIPFIL